MHTAARRSLSALLSLFVVLAFIPSFAQADTSENLQAQLAEAQEHLNDLYTEAEMVSQELNKTIDDLSVTSDKINKLSDDIATAQEQLTDAQSSLGSAVAANYKAGPTSIWDTILGATSFEDLVNRIFYADKVAESFNEKIQRVYDLKESLAVQQAELVEQRKAQERLKEEQEEHAAELEEKASAAEDFVAGLSVELQEALAAEEAAKREAERQAAEAAQAAAAAATAANDQAALVSAAAQNAPESSTATATTTTTTNTEASSSSESSSQSSSSASEQSPSSDSSGLSHMAERTIIVNYVLAQVGKDYVWATHGPDTFDCSGLVGAAYNQVGLFVGYSDSYQAQYCNKPASQAVYGDIVWRSGHVGICVGDGITVEAHTPATGIGWGSIDRFSRSGSPWD